MPMTKQTFEEILDSLAGSTITADDVVAAYERKLAKAHRPIPHYASTLHSAGVLLTTYTRRGILVPGEHKTFWVLPRAMRPTRVQRIAEELYRLEADETRIAYTIDVARACGYKRDEVVEVVRTLDRSRFRNCVPFGGGKIEIWFLRHVGSKKNDPRRVGLSDGHKNVSRLVDVMIDQLTVHAPYLSDDELHRVRRELLPVLTTVERAHTA